MSRKIIIGILFIILIITASTISIKIFNSSKTDELTGLWEYDNNTKYEFDGKGKGKIIVPMENIEFTYTIKENIVSVDFINKESRDTEYEFKISKDSLELKDLNLPSVDLNLKKVNNK